MIDKRSIDLLQLIGRDTELKKVASTGGGEYHGVCPFCGGVDRFSVQPTGRGWSCRGCTPHWQDAIAYVQRRDGVGFKQAVETLGLPLDSQPAPRKRTAARPEIQSLNEYAALSEDWQVGARAFCAQSFDKLWSKDGKRALDYLKARGISDAIIEQAGLGFNSEDWQGQWGGQDIFMHRGIVIPWLMDGQLWRVNIRRPVGEPKYMQAAGGANGLYHADSIGIEDVVMLVEGEFDCLVMQSQVKGITPVATGTVSWARVARWVSLLNTAQLVLLSFDVDANGAGDKAVDWWKAQLGDKAVRLAPPEHDVTDTWKAGHDLQAWVGTYSLWIPDYHTPEMEALREKRRQKMLTMGYQKVELS